MTDKILLKRSLVSGSIPTTASLEAGELAINVHDATVYLKQSGSSQEAIRPLLTLNTQSNGDILLSGSIELIDDLTVSGNAVVSESMTVLGSINASEITASISVDSIVDFPENVITSSAQITDLTLDNLELTAGPTTIILTGSAASGIFDETRLIEPIINPLNSSGMVVEYTAQRENSTRAGQIFSSWSDAGVSYTDFSNIDVGDTSDLSFNVVSENGGVRLRAYSAGSGSGTWGVYVLFKIFPKIV